MEITDSINELILKPNHCLGEEWQNVNGEIRALGGKWVRGQKPADGSWRIPK